MKTDQCDYFSSLSVARSAFPFDMEEEDKKTSKSTSRKPRSSSNTSHKAEKKTESQNAPLSLAEHMVQDGGASPRPECSGLSANAKEELGSIISQHLDAYFADYDYDFFEDEIPPGQGGGPEAQLPVIDIDQDIADVISANTGNEVTVKSNNAVDECLAEITVVPRGGPAMPENVSQVINNAFRQKVVDEVRTSKLKLFAIPSNCPGLDRVKVNQHIWEKIKPQTRTMDVKLQAVQSQIVAAGAGICKVLQDVSKMEPSKVSGPSIQQMTKDLLNVQVLLGQSNVDLNHRRRDLIKPDLNTSYSPLCAASTPFTEWLFGDDVGSQVNDISAANRVCDKLFPQANRGRGARGRRGRFLPYGRGQFRGRGAYGYTPRQGFYQRPYGRRPEGQYERTATTTKKTVKSNESGEPSVSVPNSPVGGRLSRYLDKWYAVTSDKSILSDVKGIRLEFCGEPQSVVSYPKIERNKSEMIVLQEEIASLLAKDVLEECEFHPDQVLSSVFFIQKPDKSYRTIFNMKRLNEVIEYHHFKMDTLETAVMLLRPNWWMASIDLKDAYYTVRVVPEDRKFLRFAVGDKLYQFKAMPMGLASAPRIFTKLVKPVLAVLRKKGIICMAYIDDLLLVGPTAESCSAAVSEGIKILTDLGFVVNYKKSQLSPLQRVRYLGFEVDSVQMKVFLPADKASRLVETCGKLLQQNSCKIQELAEFIGLILSYSKAADFGMLHYRSLERQKIAALRQSKGDYEASLELTDESLAEIQWWQDQAPSLSRWISHGNPVIIINTDASQSGWGAFNATTEQTTRGFWSQEESEWHINAKELKAAMLGLQSFCKNERDVHVQLRSDNVTTVAYIRNMGGIRSLLCDSLASELWNWCKVRGIWISATHIPGSSNDEADAESRAPQGDTEWALNDEVFRTILDVYGQPEIDLFASRINHKLSKYVAWKPDPHAIHIDAFTMSWANDYLYLFPPFSLISHVLAKVAADQAEVLVVLPHWPTAAWYSHLPYLLVDVPVFLPRMERLLTQGAQLHPLRHKLQMMVCRLSGNHSSVMNFQSLCRNISSNHGEMVPTSSTVATCDSGQYFVAPETIIPIHRL